MIGRMLCRELYQGGCDQSVEPPGWLHPEHWRTPPGDRPVSPTLRDDLSTHLLRMLATSSAPDVRQAVLTASRTPDDLIDELLSDGDEHVYATAVGRTGSAEALLRAARDRRWWIRVAVASNPRCPHEVLDMLSNDPVHDVRNHVVINPAAPDRLIDAAVGDPYEHVRGWALSRTRNLEIILRAARSNADDRRWVANNPHCPPETLARLAGDGDAQVRGGVAQNRSCPQHLNRQLQADPDNYVSNLARIMSR